MPTQIELVKELSVDHNNWHEKYPWFALGQLINASNKQADGSSTISSAAIFFNDIQRLHWLLHEPAFNKNKILSELNVPISTEGMQTTPQPFPKREHPPKIIIPNNLIAVAAVEENDAIKPTTISIKSEQVLVDDVVIHHEIKNPEDKIADEELVNQLEIQKVEAVSQPNVFIQQPQPVEIEQTSVIENKTDNINEIVSNESTQTDEKSEVAENKLLTAQNIVDTDSIENVAKSQKNIEAALNSSDGEMQLTFEPYHTIDYFASQGIKVDTKVDDKLGKQLKSFTSWLKSMKRLPSTEDANTDAPVTPIKDKSLENTNVITEAMAAVLLKQGKKEQAVEIFKQLSLLHPEKSRYFAAQIEQIKI